MVDEELSVSQRELHRMHVIQLTESLLLLSPS